MYTLQKQKKLKFSNKKLRNFIVTLSFLATTSSYVQAKGIKCEREIIGGAEELCRVMHRKDMISEETKELVKEIMLGSGSMMDKTRFSAVRLLREAEEDNVLEVQNNNSKPLMITLLDQDSNFTTELGAVPSNTTIKFHLDRNTLYDTYSVKGYLGLLRSNTYTSLSFRKFYNKIVFQSSTVGTTAQLERTADIY